MIHDSWHRPMLSRVPSSVPQVLHDGLGELHEVPRRVQQPLARLRLHHLHQPVSLLYTIQIFSLFSNSLKSWRCLKSSGTSEYLTRPTGLTAARPTPSPRQPPWSAATGAQEAPTWKPCLCLLSSKSSKSALNIVEIILWHIYSKYVFIWKVLREKVLRRSRLLREHGGPQHHLLWVVRLRVKTLSDVFLYFSARKVPFELQVNFDPSGGFPQSQYNKGFKLNYFQIPCWNCNDNNNVMLFCIVIGCRYVVLLHGEMTRFYSFSVLLLTN